MTSLTSLIERVEAATEGSRELDIAICQATDTNGYRIEDDGTILVSGDMGEGPGWFNIGYEAPPYSTSIDSALTLLPERCGWIVSNGRVWHDEPLGGARITSLEAEAATPCLALLAAILRARQGAPLTHGRQRNSSSRRKKQSEPHHDES